MADDHRPLNPQPLHEVVNADRRALHVEAVFGNIRAADPGQVRGDDGEVLGEPRHQRPPHPRCLRVPVQQEHCRAATGCQVLQLDAVGARGAHGDGATTWWLCDVPDEGALCRRGYDRGENDDERDAWNEGDLRPLGSHLRSPCPTATRAAIHAVMSPMTTSLPMSLSGSWKPPS